MNTDDKKGKVEWGLELCDKCNQMTNHDDDGCLKCRVNTDDKKGKCNMSVSFTIQTSWIIQPAKVKVTIHNSIRDMQKKCATEHIGGICQRWHIDTKPLNGQTVAHIHLHKEGLGSGLVSHEATHAALHIYMLSNKLKTLDNNDEPLCYTVGDIVSKIYKQLWKRGILQ